MHFQHVNKPANYPISYINDNRKPMTTENHCSIPLVAVYDAGSQSHSRSTAMILTNIETVPGKTIVKHLGLVNGNTVRAKHAGKDLLAGLKNIVGGELKAYTELLQESRDEATQRMIEQANAVGANAVVNVRYSTSSVSAGAAELFAYGTAVVVE
jgi:uncharacterized protein YbjQ (UPF0145 family)